MVLCDEDFLGFRSSKSLMILLQRHEISEYFYLLENKKYSNMVLRYFRTIESLALARSADLVSVVLGNKSVLK